MTRRASWECGRGAVREVSVTRQAMQETPADPRALSARPIWHLPPDLASTHPIWQENWTSNPFASSKFIIGKIVYQRDPASTLLYARPYAYRDGVLTVPAEGEEEEVESVLPSDRIKLNCMKP